MPAKKRPKPLYQRGKFALHRRAGRPNLEILWYDDDRKRERSASAGTADLEEGQIAVERLYRASSGPGLCPTCRRPGDPADSPRASAAHADYLWLMAAKAGQERKSDGE